MKALKKTLMATLAVATVAAAGTGFTTTSANAGYHYNGGYHFPVCKWKWVWRTNYYGQRYKVRIRVCH